jgi:isoleucyl-tRNA synthetase
MSKSKGNVTDPIQFTKNHGAEILRLWAIVEDYRNDVNFSMETIERISESYRKIRNTFRYILGNLFDYSHAQNQVTDFCDLDSWALFKTQKFLEKVKKAYDDCEFHLVYHALVNFCSVDLSSIYFDILKDRLYTYPKNSKERRSSQTALYQIGSALATAVAPILSFTSEEVWKHFDLGGFAADVCSSVFEEDFPLLGSFWSPNIERQKAADALEKALEYREPINKAIEEERKAKKIGHPLEAKIKVKLSTSKLDELKKCHEDLARLYIVSHIEFEQGEAFSVQVSPADGNKCARCWVFSLEVGTHHEYSDLCNRCVKAIS